MFKRPFDMLLVLATLIVPVAGFVIASDTIIRTPCPHCQTAAGVCYKEVVTHRCRMVDERKPIKKTVYECRDVPYCEQKLPKFLQSNCCPECKDCVKYKKVLVKKEIVCGEKCSVKCIVEEIVHKVPCCNHCQECLTQMPQDETVDERAAVRPVLIAEPAP